MAPCDGERLRLTRNEAAPCKPGEAVATDGDSAGGTSFGHPLGDRPPWPEGLQGKRRRSLASGDARVGKQGSKGISVCHSSLAAQVSQPLRWHMIRTSSELKNRNAKGTRSQADRPSGRRAESLIATRRPGPLRRAYLAPDGQDHERGQSGAVRDRQGVAEQPKAPSGSGECTRAVQMATPAGSRGYRDCQQRIARLAKGIGVLGTS